MKITACPIERRYKPNIKARPSLAEEVDMKILTAFGCAGLVEPPERRGGHLSVVRRLRRPHGRAKLRIHQFAAVLGNSEGQRRLVQSERLVSALSAARELRAAIPPLMSNAADHQIIAMDHLGAAFEA